MKRHEVNAKDVDQPLAALITDLKQRGLFDDTLVVITTEFGRTPAVVKPDHKGREHHAKCFSSFLAGAGVKRGLTFGKSDEYGINVVEDRVHVHDFHATILHLLGFDFQRLTYRHAGLDHKLTGVNECRVVSELLT
jgi:arylsulfatase A-like enzyme